MTGWTIYWITRLDGLQNLSNGMVIIGSGVALFLLAGLVSIMGGGCGHDDSEKVDFSKWFKRLLMPSLLCIITGIIGSVFLPTTKEAAAIYLLPKIVNNQQVQELPDNALKFLNAKLEEWIDENKPKKK